MNVVRYYLCLCIIMNHFNVLCQSSLPALPRIFGGVGSFFTISGFLMFYSFEKHRSLKGYINRRLRRILPPYVFIVIFAAFGLSVISTLSFSDYFTDWQLYKYLICNLTFLNFLEPSLPGVFDSGLNYISAVNGSLWTMKGEVICYFFVPFVFAFINKHSKYVFQILTALIVICFSLYLEFTIYCLDMPESIVNIIAKQFRMFTFFFIGAILNLCLGYIRKYKWNILIIVLGLMFIAETDNILHLIIRPFTDSVLVIWFSMIGSWGNFMSGRNIVSYEMYLFHFPIIQVLVALGLICNLWLALFFAIGLTIGLAFFSWKFVDKPILG